MTLDETTQHILAAVELQDLAALQEAAKERERAIAELASIPPTAALRDAVARSLAAGEEAKLTIRAIRQRIRKESRRLASIEHTFVRALRPATMHQIDCKG